MVRQQYGGADVTAGDDASFRWRWGVELPGVEVPNRWGDQLWRLLWRGVHVANSPSGWGDAPIWMRQDRCGGRLTVGTLVRTGCKKISGLMECTCDCDLESDLGLSARHADEQSESALAAIRHHADGVSRAQRAISWLSIGLMGGLG